MAACQYICQLPQLDVTGCSCWLVDVQVVVGDCITPVLEAVQPLHWCKQAVWPEEWCLTSLWQQRSALAGLHDAWLDAHELQCRMSCVMQKSLSSWIGIIHASPLHFMFRHVPQAILWSCLKSC